MDDNSFAFSYSELQCVNILINGNITNSEFIHSAVSGSPFTKLCCTCTDLIAKVWVAS